MITNATAKAATPAARPYKITDSGGLYLYVSTTGLRSWRMKFRFGGKEKLLTFGTFPEQQGGALSAVSACRPSCDG